MLQVTGTGAVVSLGRFVVMAAVGASLLAGCKHKAPEPVARAAPVVIDTAPPQQTAVAALVSNFSRVHFETDSSSIDDESKRLLAANAAILQAHPEIKVEVQGHADERGTTDYNLALGQRRANTVVGYLVNQGVSMSRLPVVTYGEERPAANGSSETAWAQNRRAEFRVLSVTPQVNGTVNL